MKYNFLIIGLVIGLVVGSVAVWFAKPPEIVEKVVEVPVGGEELEALQAEFEEYKESVGFHGANIGGGLALPNQWVDTTKYAKDSPWKIGVSIPHAKGIPFLSLYVAEIMDEAKNYPITEVMVTYANDDLEKQMSDVRYLIERGADLIILCPLGAGMKGIVEELYEEDYPIVIDWADPFTDKYVANTSVNNCLFGEYNALWLEEQINEKLGGEAKIIMMSAVEGYTNTVERDMKLEEMVERNPGIEIVAKDYGGYLASEAKKKMEDMLAAHPDFDAIWSTGGWMGSGCVDALVEAGYDPSEILMVGEWSIGFMRKIVNYDIPAHVSGHAPYTGRYSLQVAVNILRGMPVVHSTIHPPGDYDREEIDMAIEKYGFLPDDAYVGSLISEEELREILEEFM